MDKEGRNSLPLKMQTVVIVWVKHDHIIRKFEKSIAFFFNIHCQAIKLIGHFKKLNKWGLFVKKMWGKVKISSMKIIRGEKISDLLRFDRGKNRTCIRTTKLHHFWWNICLNKGKDKTSPHFLIFLQILSSNMAGKSRGL